MKYMMRQFVWGTKYFVGIIFQSCIICFQDWWFSCLVTRCRRIVFAAIGELILLTPKSSKEGLDSQWEGWQSSKHRESSGSTAAREQWLKDIVSAVHGMSEYSGDWRKDFDMTWKQIDKLLWVQKPFSGKVWSKSGSWGQILLKFQSARNAMKTVPLRPSRLPDSDGIFTFSNGVRMEKLSRSVRRAK
jgi:hypothetical protein